MKRPPGRVYLVGAGPGAPDLLTVRAAEVLRRAEIVFHDALIHPDVLGLATGARRIAVGKRCGRLATAQQFINKRLIDAARAHGVVVRLKGGDPMLFGRAREEIEALQAAGIEWEVIPGVTAALAASAQAGVALTQRGLSRSVAFVTPRVGRGEAPSDWARAAVQADTAAIYMGAGDAAAITAALLAAGAAPDLPVLVVENASLPEFAQHSLPLAQLPQIAGQLTGGPAVILIGQVYADVLAAALGAASARQCSRSA